MGFTVRTLKQAAAEYLRAQPPAQPAQLQGLLRRTAAFLRADAGFRFDVSELAADRAALDAWSELAAEQARAYVDLSASSPQLLVLVDEVTKTRRLVPVVDLVRILGPRVAAA